MSLSTQLEANRIKRARQAEEILYNSRKERKKRRREKKRIAKNKTALETFRELLPSVISKALNLDTTKIVEMKCVGVYASRFDLVYLVDDLFLGFNFKTNNVFRIKRFTKSSVNVSLLFTGHNSCSGNCKLLSFRLYNMSLSALDRAIGIVINNRKFISIQYRDNKLLRELFKLVEA